MRFTGIKISDVENDSESKNAEYLENVEFEMMYDPVWHDRNGRVIKDGKIVRTFTSVVFQSTGISSMLAEVYEQDLRGAFHRKFLRLYA